MISHLNGILEHIDKNYLVVEVGNVGYHVKVSSSTLSRLPKIGEQIKLFTCQVVREDDISLYGFVSKEERSLFTLLLSVSGIGPKVSLALISSFPVDKLVAAITSGNVALISSVPGIGKKTAQKLVIELKDKVAKAYALKPADLALGITEESPLIGDAIAALIALGYSSREARQAILQCGADFSKHGIEDVIKLSLKSLV